MTKYLSMIRFHIVFFFVIFGNGWIAGQTNNQPANSPLRILLIVVGAEGTPELGKAFEENSAKWQTTFSANQFEVRKIAGVGDPSAPIQRDQLKATIEEISTRKPAEFWIVLIGHGSFDGKVAKFNLIGPDVSAEETADWLDGLPAESTTVVINTAACSGGFLRPLSKSGRIVVTATKSGSEVNLTRFGLFLSKTISDQQADLDKDGRTSLLEAFLSASKQTEDFYTGESRLATEHALIEDNGDAKGTAASWFTGWRVTGRAKDGTQPDGAKANQLFLRTISTAENFSAEQLAERNRLELEIEALVRKKSTMTTDDYYRELESLLLKLARLNAAAEGADQSLKE